METEKQHGPQGKGWCMSVYKHAYLKVKTHFHCMCRFISHSSYVWRIDHYKHRHERWKYLTATNKMLNWMRCDGERISGHGMDSTSAPFGLKAANTSLKSIVLVQEKLLWPYSLCSFSSHLTDSSFSMNGEKSQMPSVNWMILWYFYQIMLFQTILMQK